MIQEYLADYCAGLSKALEGVSRERFEEFIQLLEDAYHHDRQVFFMGNGGSGSTASHFICDLNKGVSYGRSKRFRGTSLNDNLATITAYANDVAYEDVFVEQLKNFLRARRPCGGSLRQRQLSQCPQGHRLREQPWRSHGWPVRFRWRKTRRCGANPGPGPRARHANSRGRPCDSPARRHASLVRPLVAPALGTKSAGCAGQAP